MWYQYYKFINSFLSLFDIICCIEIWSKNYESTIFVKFHAPWTHHIVRVSSMKTVVNHFSCQNSVHWVFNMNDFVFGGSLLFHKLSIATEMTFECFIEPILLVACFRGFFSNRINRLIVFLPFIIPRVDKFSVLSFHNRSPSHLCLVEMRLG